jgi:alkanesulfonate monooxygenase
MAAAVDELAGGRLILGVGAGWHEAEHEAFAIPFPSLRERFDLLERGIDVMERTWRTSAPRPPRGGRIPLLIGGSGERRTLGLAARHAAEWNAHGLDEEAYAAKARVLEERCREVRRDPATIRRSLMSGFLVGRDRHDLRERAARMAAFLPGYEGLEPDELLRRLGPLWLVGTPEEIVDRMRGYVRYGVDLFMLQHFLMDDADALQVLAAEVMPALASG